MAFNRNALTAGWAVAAIFFLQQPHAEASTLGDPFFEGSYSFTIDGVGTSTEVNAPAAYSGTQASTVDGQSGSVSFSLAGNPIPTIALSAVTTGGGAGAEGQISYQFMIVGAAGLVPTSLLFEGGASLVTDAAVPSASASSYVAFGSLAGNPQYVSDVYSVSQSGTTSLSATHSLNGVVTSLSDASFSESDSFDLTANTPYSISMSAVVGATGDTTSTASVDPLITIDPAFAGRYSIELSPGIGNAASPVPLPGSLGLMASALVVFGIVGYSRKRWSQAPLYPA